MAEALGRAFRPMILHDQIRDAKLQMEEVAKLKSDESVTILDSNFKPIYFENAGEKTPDHCAKGSVPCWLSNGTQVSISLPVYFDDDTKSELYGYLILKLRPSVDWFEILMIVFGSGLIFFLQVRGIYSSLKRESNHIEKVLMSWKNRVDNPKFSEPEDEEKKLFTEFLPLHQSINSLHNKISGLEIAAASSAATKAKTDIVRGLGHDLKTPLSQLSKFFSVFVTNTKTNQTVDEKEVERIENTMKRMGSLIRQVTNLGRKLETPSRTNLTLWLTAYCNELNADPELTKTATEIRFDCSEREDLYSTIHETDLFRLVDNIVRNAIEALPTNRTLQNRVILSLKIEDGKQILTIADNGVGIPEALREQIFDLDFTTKKTRGTGLGLGIVKKICTDSNLGIDFSSEENSGTRFTIDFPIIDVGIRDKVFKGEVVV